MLINFLLNEDEGIEISGTERGIPCSKKAIEILNEKGIGDEMVKEANSKVTAYSKFPLDPYFEHNDLKANPDGVYYKVFGKLSAGNTTSARLPRNCLRALMSATATTNPQEINGSALSDAAPFEGNSEYDRKRNQRSS